MGDTETPGSVGPVRLGPGRTASAITAGDSHTCALLDDGDVRCWGYGADGQLGYGSVGNVGDDETPDLIGPVELGTGRSAVAVAAGDFHTRAVLDDGNVRCWGYGANGQLGYAGNTSVGDNEIPAAAGPSISAPPARRARSPPAASTHAPASTTTACAAGAAAWTASWATARRWRSVTTRRREAPLPWISACRACRTSA